MEQRLWCLGRRRSIMGVNDVLGGSMASLMGLVRVSPTTCGDGGIQRGNGRHMTGLWRVIGTWYIFRRVTDPLCGNSPVTGEFPHKGQWRGALMISLIFARINGWVNNQAADDMRRHRTHYHVTAMDLRYTRAINFKLCFIWFNTDILRCLCSILPSRIKSYLEHFQDFICWICCVTAGAVLWW